MKFTFASDGKKISTLLFRCWPSTAPFNLFYSGAALLLTAGGGLFFIVLLPSFFFILFDLSLLLVCASSFPDYILTNLNVLESIVAPEEVIFFQPGAHTCPERPSQVGSHDGLYNAPAGLEFHQKSLECYEVHILERPVRPRAFYNLWIPDYEAIQFNEGRKRDIEFHRTSVNLWAHELPVNDQRISLKREFYRHAKRTDWNNKYAYYVYPALLLSMVVGVLKIVIN